MRLHLGLGILWNLDQAIEVLENGNASSRPEFPPGVFGFKKRGVSKHGGVLDSKLAMIFDVG